MISYGSEEESKILEEFKKKTEDLTLWGAIDIHLRFLRARNHDLAKAEELLRSSVKWRQENDIGSYLNWTSSCNLDSELPWSILHDVQNSQSPVVIYFPLGAWDVKSLVESGHGDEIMKYFYKIMETCADVSKKMKRSSAIVLIDFEFHTFARMTHWKSLQIFYSCFHILESHYPEVLEKLFIINAPRIFSPIFAVVKTILTGNTITKVHLFGSNKQEWLPALKNFIPDTCLPSNLL